MIATSPINGNAVKGMKISQNGLDIDYGSNAFKSRLWTYLSRSPSWTYKEYQNRAKDNVTKEQSFVEVKRDIELWCIWDPQHNQMVPKSPSNLERIEGLIARLLPPKEITPVAPIAAAPIPAAHQIALPERGRTHNKLDPDLKHLARELFIKNPDITYEAIQKELGWKEFSTTNFYSMRSKLRIEGAIPMLEGDNISHGRKLSGDVALARKNLAQLKLSELETLTCPKYKEMFGHHGIEPHNYYNANRWAIKEARAKLPPPIVAPVAVAGTKAAAIIEQPKPMVAKNTVKIIATIDLAEFKPDAYMPLQRAFKSYFDQRAAEAGKTHSLQFMVTTDPATLEIRKKLS
jgi:hypothetical protein